MLIRALDCEKAGYDVERQQRNGGTPMGEGSRFGFHAVTVYPLDSRPRPV
jgi:hypothetical protein